MGLQRALSLRWSFGRDYFYHATPCWRWQAGWSLELLAALSQPGCRSKDIHVELGDGIAIAGRKALVCGFVLFVWQGAEKISDSDFDGCPSARHYHSVCSCGAGDSGNHLYHIRVRHKDIAGTRSRRS